MAVSSSKRQSKEMKMKFAQYNECLHILEYIRNRWNSNLRIGLQNCEVGDHPEPGTLFSDC